MERKRTLLCLLISVLTLLGSAHSQPSFSYESSVNAPGLQIDSTGRTFVSAGSTLYRLSAELVEEERVSLSADVVDRGLTLSGDGVRLVACLTNLSCSVFNASDLSAGPLRTVDNAIASAEFGVALFTAGDTFYTGSVSGTGMADRILLQQNGFGDIGEFVRSSDENDVAHGGAYSFSGEFSRRFYGGFERQFAYYVAFDYDPSTERAFRLLRVCNTPDCGNASRCGVNALYEASFLCGANSVSNRVRVCGVSVLEDFGGMTGTIAVVSRCESGTSRNTVCLVNITAIDEMMDIKYSTCSSAGASAADEVDVVWDEEFDCFQAFEIELDQPTGRCNFPRPLGVDLTSFSEISTSRVGTGSDEITSSVAMLVEGISFVFVATTSTGGSMVSGYDAGSFTGTPFSTKPANSIVHQLSWQQGQDYVTAATTDNVFQIPIEECSSYTDCASCTADLNPLCGWCVVENKCSRQTQCQNSTLNTTVRWTQDSNNCITVTVNPSQLVLDSLIPTPELNVTVNPPGLPAPLSGEVFSCHLADSEGRFPAIVVPAVELTPGTLFSCNITGRVPAYQGVTAVMSVGFESSLFNAPFDITNEALTIHRCFQGSSCSDCLQDNSPCGWCNLNKVCSGTSTPCRNDSFYLQLSGNTFSDLCPLVEQSPSGDYTQPVRVNQDIRLSTRNFIPPTDVFQYDCLVNGVQLSTLYENDSSILCLVDSEDLTLSSGVGSAVVAAMVIWSGGGISYTIDSVQTETTVTLYDCRELADGCSSCVGTRMGSGFLCGWCEGTCEVTDECSNMFTFITTGGSCPAPTITDFSPISGPVEGGTAVTVMGSDLGVTFNDLVAGMVTLGGVACTPIDRDYMPGTQFVCETTDFSTPGDKNFVVSVSNGQTSSGGPRAFTAVRPAVTSVSPDFGPEAGGSRVTVRGTGLDVGNQGDTMATLQQGRASVPCDTRLGYITANEIVCVTGAGNKSLSALVVVAIDNARVSSPSVIFNYRNNPNVTSVTPDTTIPSGGITLTFSGGDLDVVQVPVLEVRLSVGGPLRTNCTPVSESTITCVAPGLPGEGGGEGLDYSLILDAAPPTTSSDFTISIRSDPSNFRLGDTREVATGSSTTIIQILGDNLQSVSSDEINVTVGGLPCVKTTAPIVDTIFCTAPPSVPGASEAEIRVMVGLEIDVALADRISYTSNELPLVIIIPSVVGGLVLVIVLFLLIMCCIVCGYKSKHKKTEQRWTNLLAQMELLEVEMADECKRAFTELQTDLADLVHITDQNLPYRDFRTFAMRFLFPQDGAEHPVLHPLVLPEKADREQVATQLKSFQHLVMDKKFLFIFVRTLEAQGHKFTLNDRCIVASLLMVCFQNDLDYATEILHTLLAELMRMSLTKNSHPKLLLRRTESVAEKMLANWLAFLLFPYLLEHVGEKLFILFRAIKSQLEKGAVDIITGEAKNSLSEEKLLRHHRDVKVVDGLVVADSGEEFPVRLLDCDSITQAKEKVLDVLYKNTPVSKRPQLTEIDLELISTGTAGIPLRDQDATNAKDGEWTKVNTLGHYKLDEMSQAHADNPRNPVPKFRIVMRPERPVSGLSFDTLGTIIANQSRASLILPNEMMSHIYHLVKPEPEEPGEGARGQKIVSEVFLTRLLSTKRILQPYVDDLFESIFAIPHGRPLPKAIKSLFDFLDQQAAELGIQDPEILHTWKTNSVPLRFWVNVIKNPDFLFDIHKSATVDSCLTVIAQAYIDACSTTEFKYSKDTPAARLLYVNDVKKYKSEVLRYFGTIQSLPKVSQREMCEYLRETAQVCADSVQQYASDIPSEKTVPTSMKGQLYFVTESALYELFKFATRFSEEITEGLNEEGLTIQAASFDQIRRSMKAATHS